MLTLIAAVDNGNSLGSSNKNPWYSPTDLEFFRKETIGSALIVDRAAYTLMDTEFKQRKILIIDPLTELPKRDEVVFRGVVDALKHCWHMTYSRVYVIGGLDLYQEMLCRADRVLLSISKEAAADPGSVFPALTPDEWSKSQLWLPECPVVPIITEYLRKI